MLLNLTILSLRMIFFLNCLLWVLWCISKVHTVKLCDLLVFACSISTLELDSVFNFLVKTEMSPHPNVNFCISFHFNLFYQSPEGVDQWWFNTGQQEMLIFLETINVILIRVSKTALSTQCSPFLFKILFLSRFPFIIHLCEDSGQQQLCPCSSRLYEKESLQISTGMIVLEFSVHMSYETNMNNVI